MDKLKRAVFFLEEEQMIPPDSKPLMLEAVLSRPILTRVSRQLLADGVQRFFAVTPPRFAAEVLACFPEGTDVTAAEQHAALMDFLDTEEWVLVLPRAALPFSEAGAGFAYAAPGRALRETWMERMTNAVQEAELVPGWVPVYGRETIEELTAILRAREQDMPEL